MEQSKYIQPIKTHKQVLSETQENKSNKARKSRKLKNIIHLQAATFAEICHECGTDILNVHMILFTMQSHHYNNIVIQSLPGGPKNIHLKQPGNNEYILFNYY